MFARPDGICLESLRVREQGACTPDTNGVEESAFHQSDLSTRCESLLRRHPRSSCIQVSVRRFVALTLLLLLFSAAAAAQIPTKGNVFFGYSYARTDLTPPPPHPDEPSLAIPASNANGWNGSLEGRLFPHVGIVADISGHYGTWSFTQGCGLVVGCTPTQGRVSASIHSIVFGPRLSVSVGKFTPFLQALFGVSRFSSDLKLLGFGKTQTGFTNSVGGGLDYKLIRSIGWRLQTDWMRHRFFDNTHSNFRFSTGPVLRF